MALVGHSLGGLVGRVACATERRSCAEADSSRHALLTDVVTLGTPHLGADLARAVRACAQALARVPEAAPFGRVLDHRSPGG